MTSLPNYHGGDNEGMYLGADLVTPQLLALLLSLRQPLLLTPESSGWRLSLGAVPVDALARWLAAHPQP